MNQRNKGHLFCCGDLQSGGVAVGITNLVTIGILYMWIIQVLLELKHFFIGIVIASVITFILIVVNVLLLCGSKSRKKSLLVPWLVSYLIIFILIIVVCSIQFKDLGQLQPIAVVALFILAYFYAIIVTFYHEILLEPKKTGYNPNSKVKISKDLISLEEGSPLHDLQEEEGMEDTFTELANQRNYSKNNFLRCDTASSSSFLPQPEEVIQVNSFEAFKSDNSVTQEAASTIAAITSQAQELPKNLTESVNLSTGTDISQNRNLFSKSIDLPQTLTSNDSTTNCVDTPDGATSASYREQNDFSRPEKKFSHSHSGLIDIDSTFSPFKQKEDQKKMPKMKIFLPKDEETSSEEEDDHNSCSSSSDVEKATKVNMTAKN